MQGRRKSTHSRCMTAKCLLLRLLLIHYPTNIAHEKSRILEVVHYWVPIALKHYFIILSAILFVCRLKLRVKTLNDRFKEIIDSALS